MRISRTLQSSRVTIFLSKEEATRYPGPYVVSIRASLDAVDVTTKAERGVEGWVASSGGLIIRTQDRSKLKPFGAMEVTPVASSTGFTIMLPETRRMPRIIKQPKRHVPKTATSSTPALALSTPALRDLVRWINAHKEQMGDDMVLEVKDGRLRVLISYGDLP